MTTNIRKLMEALENLNQTPSQELVSDFDSELDALIQRTWQTAEDLSSDPGVGDFDFIVLETQLEKVLKSYMPNNINEELSDKEFGQIRSDQEDSAREFLVAGFDANLDSLLRKAAEDADRIGGEYRGPGIRRQLYKIAKAAVLKELGNNGQ